MERGAHPIGSHRGRWDERGADIDTYARPRTTPARAISGGARRHVRPVSYATQCPRGPGPHAAVARGPHPSASAIRQVAVNLGWLSSGATAGADLRNRLDRK